MTNINWLETTKMLISPIASFVATIIGAVIMGRMNQPKVSPEQKNPNTLAHRAGRWFKIFRNSVWGLPSVLISLNIWLLYRDLTGSDSLTKHLVFSIALNTCGIMFGFICVPFLSLVQLIRDMNDLQGKIIKTTIDSHKG